MGLTVCIVNLKCILYPGCFLGLQFRAVVNTHNIKAAGDFYGFKTFQHIKLRCFNQFLLFAIGHAIDGGAVAKFSAESYLYKYQGVTVNHDEVDFPCFFQKITLPKAQTLVF